jgi:predicted nucleotidyltransferase
VEKYAPPSHLWWANRILLRVEVGSTAHGTGLPDAEDYDEMAIMADPYDAMVGLAPFDQTITYRPGRAEGERSQPGDYDLVVHGARKFCRLAAQGNPSILMALYGPIRASNALGRSLREQAGLFYSDRARQRFLGYAKAQRERLLGIRGGKHTNRPELIEEHGYDTKYAMHMVRLGYQGIEYMRDRRLRLPIRPQEGDELRAIRRGERSLTEVLEIAQLNEYILKQRHWDAPREPDYSGINAWLRAVAAEYGHHGLVAQAASR